MTHAIYQDLTQCRPVFQIPDMQKFNKRPRIKNIQGEKTHFILEWLK